MRTPDTQTYAQSLADIETALQPIIYTIAKDQPACLSAAIFVPDAWHADTANTITMAHAPAATANQLNFTETAIRGHRVDLAATTVGRALLMHESGPGVSRMNPQQHVVWSEYFETPQPAALQLIFDRSQVATLDESKITRPIRAGLSEVAGAVAAFQQDTAPFISAGDVLELDIPTTPNAYVVTWDEVRSTKQAAVNWPRFRGHYQEFGRLAQMITAMHDARIVAPTGDGQNIVLDLPADVNRSNPTNVAQFGRDRAVPFMQALAQAHQTLAANYPVNRPKIRLGLGLGYVEQLQTGEWNGPVFWEVKQAMAAHHYRRQDFNMTPLARQALRQA